VSLVIPLLSYFYAILFIFFAQNLTCQFKDELEAGYNKDGMSTSETKTSAFL
jgi:hypothetical protein